MLRALLSLVLSSALVAVCSGIRCRRGNPQLWESQSCSYSVALQNGTTVSQEIMCCATAFSGAAVTLACAGPNDDCEERCYRNSPAHSGTRFVRSRTCFCQGEHCNSPASALAASSLLSSLAVTASLCALLK